MRGLLIILLLPLFTVQAQDLVFEQNTENVLSDTDFGPNKKFYRHEFFAWGLPIVTNPSEEVSAIALSSFSFESGSRVKLKLSNTFSLGTDWGFGYEQFSIRSSDRSLFPGLIGVDAPDTLRREKLKNIQVNVAPYFRINVGQRGDHLGSYFYFAFRAEWIVGSWYTTKFNSPNSSQFDRFKTTFKGVEAQNKIQFYPELRFGRSVYNFYIRYRLLEGLDNAKMLNTDLELQLPTWKIGVALNIPN